MPRALTSILLPLLVLLVTCTANARTVQNLYTAEVVAEGRSQQALARASREALAQVVVKVSGSGEALKNPAISSALGNARNYIQQYSFLEDTDEGVGVRFEFNGSAITDLVTDAGAPLWTANRPVVLVWVVVDGPSGPHFLSRDSEPDLSEALMAAFGRRGVPAQLPLFDLADATALRADEVWRLSMPAVELASQRYERDDVLVGRVSFGPDDTVQGDWHYLSRSERLDRKVEPTSQALLMDAGVGLVADVMAARYAVAPTAGAEGGVLMSVEGIRSYADYAAVVTWLQGVELIESANVVRIAGDRLELRLLAQADASQLAGIIRLNERFQPAPSGDPTIELSYLWRN